MNIFDQIRNRFSSAAATPAPPVEHELLVSRSTVHAPTFLKKGMWVRTSEGIGIIVSFHENGETEVHLTDADGFTIASMNMSPAQIMGQARYEDIPAPRRPARKAAATLGYI